MLAELRREFEARFGRSPDCAARAPGRINLIGEHTDYNDGLVLPGAIDRDTVVLAARRPGGAIRAFSRELAQERSFELAGPASEGGWIAYVRGVVSALAAEGMEIGGLDLAIASEVPLESGLSSSAALCVAIVTAIDADFDLGLSALVRARIAHRAESEFVGVGCGLMDPLASALGQRGAVLRIDCRSLAVEPVALPSALRILVVHSGVRRALAEGRYQVRRDECYAALRAARRARIAPAGASALRDLSTVDLPALEEALPSPVFRRARHVISENARVGAVCRALRADDLVAAGALLKEGMRSLRDDFEVSTPELDALCELGDAAPGVYGSRLTGAGFGGCTIHLVSPDAVADAAEQIQHGFEGRFGRRPPVQVLRTADGASRLY